MNNLLKSLYTGIKPGPVLLGAFVDIVLTFFFAILALPVFLPQGAFDLDDEQFQRALETAITGTPYAIAALLFGCLASLIGAYVAARRAGCLELKHGLWVVIASTTIVLLVPDDAGPDTVPLWVDWIGWLLIIPSGIAGGYLAKKQAQLSNRNKEPS